MPRPGYEIEDDGAFDTEDALTGKFDAENATEVRRLLQSGALTESHVAQLYRLTCSSPEDREPEELAGIIEMAAGMDAGKFEDWVGERIRAWRDQ